ncbi:DsrE family protein [Methylobacterium phyllosphaerae]
MAAFRSLMLAIVFVSLGIGAARAGTDAPAGYYADQKVVYHNGGGGPEAAAYFKRLLGNLRNHVEAVGKAHVEIRVVSLGDGVALFQSAANDEGLSTRIDALKAMGVRFLVCANTLRERKIDRRTLYGVVEDDVVPSGVAELARLQGMGFAYIHP